MRAQFALIVRDPVLRMLCLAVLLTGTYGSSIGIYQSLIGITVFHLSDTAYSVVLAGILAMSVSASVGIGIVTDQRPSRRRMAMLATAMMICGASTVWLGHAPVFFVLAHVGMIPFNAALFGQVFAVTRLQTAHLSRRDRDGIMAIVRALFAVPFVIVLPLWGRSFAAGLPLTTVYPVAAGVAATLLALILFAWPRDAVAPWTEQKSGLGFRASLREMAHPPLLLRVMLVGAIHSGSAIAGVILSLVFEQAAHRTTADVGLFFGIFVAIEVAVTLSVGQVLKLLPRLKIIALGAVTYAIFLLLLPWVAPTPYVWLLTIPAGAGGALIYALAIGYLQDLLGARAGAGSSLLAVMRIAADGLCAAIFAVGTWLGGYSLVAIMGATTMVLAISLILWLDRGRHASI
ncbi:MAG: hypothetical protein GC146_09705 [Limimaricola sp.]|uniref:MFS transporter n=1 Tax=Limimaricola sp. TaxID=2211665 RepID=UPI001D890670|nr:MFS transporter [Limimaricola sp.]MBI1417483.1 hypothetical protein [Limimaricola sp.]